MGKSFTKYTFHIYTKNYPTVYTLDTKKIFTQFCYTISKEERRLKTCNWVPKGVMGSASIDSTIPPSLSKWSKGLTLFVIFKRHIWYYMTE
jgi:hypothetical protein